jgi:hypothetical protein
VLHQLAVDCLGSVTPMSSCPSVCSSELAWDLTCLDQGL